jgi:hypothetical protein
MSPEQQYPRYAARPSPAQSEIHPIRTGQKPEDGGPAQPHGSLPPPQLASGARVAHGTACRMMLRKGRIVGRPEIRDRGLLGLALSRVVLARGFALEVAGFFGHVVRIGVEQDPGFAGERDEALALGPADQREVRLARELDPPGGEARA